jgi:hypothetical protein
MIIAGLALAALILAGIELANSKGRSLVAWAVVLLAAAHLPVF